MVNLVILWIIALIIAIFLIYKFVKGLILLLIWFFLDVNQLRQELATGNKIILLEENNTVLTGFMSGEKAEFISSERFVEYSMYLSNKSYSKILNNKTQLLILDIDAVKDFDFDYVTVSGANVTKQEIVMIFRDEGAAIQRVQDELGMGVREEVKAYFLSVVLTEMMNENNQIFFLEQYKKGKIIIYPKTITYTVIKYIPLLLIKKG